MKIFKNLEKFDPYKGSFESWISTITIRLCLTKLKSKHMRVVSLDLQEFEEVKDERSILILDQLKTDDLIKLIKELPADFRTVFNMLAIDGYKHEEISNQLGISVGLSRARLSRAKGMLRDKINNLNNQELWVNTI